jgi:hypothetical protein
VKAQELAAMLAEDRAEWALLVAALDAHPNAPLHDPESPEWTARDVYAHLAHWIEHSTAAFESWLATRALPASQLEGSDDEINARWQAEDQRLTLDEARAWAQRAFDRRIAVIERTPADGWDAVLDATADADGARHYRNHRRYIVVAR